ncbi:MAG: hypothetical protein WA979_03195, partial [Pacificimonas sp.]
LFPVILGVQLIAGTIFTVLFIAWGMMLSNPAVAASQFAVIMAIPNFARSSLSAAAGPIIESDGVDAVYFAVAALTTGAVLLSLYASRRLDQVGEQA